MKPPPPVYFYPLDAEQMKKNWPDQKIHFIAVEVLLKTMMRQEEWGIVWIVYDILYTNTVSAYGKLGESHDTLKV